MRVRFVKCILKKVAAEVILKAGLLAKVAFFGTCSCKTPSRSCKRARHMEPDGCRPACGTHVIR